MGKTLLNTIFKAGEKRKDKEQRSLPCISECQYKLVDEQYYFGAKVGVTKWRVFGTNPLQDDDAFLVSCVIRGVGPPIATFWSHKLIDLKCLEVVLFSMQCGLSRHMKLWRIVASLLQYGASDFNRDSDQSVFKWSCLSFGDIIAHIYTVHSKIQSHAYIYANSLVSLTNSVMGEAKLMSWDRAKQR